MTRPPAEPSATRFARVEEAFATAWQRSTGDRSESHYRLIGHSTRLRIAGRLLGRHVESCWTHLRSADTAPERPPQLTIDLWDVRATGVAAVEAARQAAGRSWSLIDAILATSADGRLVSYEVGGSVIWLDRRSGHMVGWFEDGERLSLNQRAKPLQMLLALWANDRGVQAVHAALVSRHGAGVLIPGNSGAGKSTTALGCLAAGYTYLGDDWAGLGPLVDGELVGYGIYGSVLLDPAHAARFPELQPHAIPSHDPIEPKSLVLLSELMPDRLAGSTALRALALPRIVGPGQGRRRPASKRDALLMLAPSSIFTMRPRSGREELERLAVMVERLPAHWIDFDDDLAAIARHVDAILED